MDFPSPSPEDFSERSPVSATPSNVTCLEDLLLAPPGSNGTSGAPARDTARLIIAVCITALYSLICVVGLLGNVLVMYGVVRYTKLKTATNIYIFNLALADALATSTLPFQSAKYLMSTWPFGELLCKAVIAIDYYNMFTSIFTLTMMSVDRYIAVTDNGSTACTLTFPEPEWYWDTVTKVCVFIFAFLGPVLIITICYGLMILRLKSVRLLSGSKEKDRNLRRITRMVLVVVAAFIICWTPIHIFIIVKTMVHIDRNNLLVMASWHLSIALGYINSSLNPVLYAFLDENFKRCFRDFCLPGRSSSEQSSFSRARNSAKEPAYVCAPADPQEAPT
ncbi:hypothetical protein OJAV_G00156210 [Oryzias javanicus]|uniref:G-protein coupled receptors family 1 profile domain-containing protein n=1 Tax=Oryzias javanicus TaxID=123683 RepID=A0A3S2NYF0_ORYJA|nr:hypothetical protein OJAV_G00156210 [Oryzias javanicus]